jgi:inosine-uridine nucleoside N-ribohydrolase
MIERVIMRKKKIIIDTDPGLDDALALILALKSRNLDVSLVTTVAGNSKIDNATKNAKYILNLLEIEDIPISSGSEKPLKKDLTTAGVHGEKGLGALKHKTNMDLNGKAVNDMISVIENNPGEITLVALGPLTNIAKAIKKNPESIKKVKEFVVMGGAIDVKGNITEFAEFNFFVDPEAAEIVLNFPVKKTIVPLDICNKIFLTLDDFKKIRDPNIRKPVLTMMSSYIDNMFQYHGIKHAIMFDPLTIYYLLRPNLKTEKYNLVIEKEGNKRGMILKGSVIKNASVLKNISLNKFKADFIQILNS